MLLRIRARTYLLCSSGLPRDQCFSVNVRLAVRAVPEAVAGEGVQAVDALVAEDLLPAPSAQHMSPPGRCAGPTSAAPAPSCSR